MTIPRLYRTEAIVLRDARLGEADRLVTLLTPHRGKLKAVIRGALRPRSKLAGHLLPLSHTLVQLARGKTFEVVTGCQLLQPFLPLRQDLVRMSRALYLAELVDRFLPEEMESPATFGLLLTSLGWLCRTEDGEPVLRYFELRLLDQMGFRPELYRCPGCRQPVGGATSYFSPEAGGALCPGCAADQPCRPLPPGVLRLLRLLQEGDATAIDRLHLSPALAAQVEGVLREYLHHLLERGVRAEAWLDRLRREALTPT